MLELKLIDVSEGGLWLPYLLIWLLIMIGNMNDEHTLAASETYSMGNSTIRLNKLKNVHSRILHLDWNG